MMTTTSSSSSSHHPHRLRGTTGSVLRLVLLVFGLAPAAIYQVRMLASFFAAQQSPLLDGAAALSSASTRSLTATIVDLRSESGTTNNNSATVSVGPASVFHSSNLPRQAPDQAAQESPPAEEDDGRSPSSSLFHNNNQQQQHGSNIDIVHVVRTRFQQKQPHLLHLGRARLQLFEQFCLPSILAQTQTATATTASASGSDVDVDYDFIWIIRTDPDLHPELKRALLDLVRPHRHIFVVPSLQYPDGFRREGHALLKQNELWSGSRPLLQRLVEAAQTRPVLETRLDADDGLASDYLAAVRRRAARALLALASSKKEEEDAGNNNNNKNKNNNSTAISSRSSGSKHWRVWCVESVLEWQMFGGGSSSSTSSTTQNHQHNSSEHRGAWREVTSNVCETPGLTWLYDVATKPGDRPTGAHHLIYRTIPACRHNDGEMQCYETVAAVQQSSAKNNCTAAAVRARTPTSAGMKDIALLDDNDDDKNSNNNNNTALLLLAQQQDAYWRDVTQKFAVNETAVTDVRRALRSDLRNIVREALQGQCLPGGVPGTCKPASAAQLNRLLASLARESEANDDKEQRTTTAKQEE